MMNTEKLEHRIKNKLLLGRADFAALSKKLSALSPLDTLARGYSVVFSYDGELVSSVSDVSADDSISIRLSDGVVEATVCDSKPDKKTKKEMI